MACPASMRDVDAAGLAADPVPEADDEQATSSQAKTRIVTGRAMCRTCNPCMPGRARCTFASRHPVVLATHRTCKVVPRADFGQESHDPVGVGRAMRSRSSRWARAVVLWTVALLLVAIVLAVVAVASLYDAQQACFFDTSTRCPEADDWRVGAAHLRPGRRPRHLGRRHDRGIRRPGRLQAVEGDLGVGATKPRGAPCGRHRPGAFTLRPRPGHRSTAEELDEC